MHRFFLSEPLSTAMTVRGQDARHISRVLRLSVGDEILVVAPDGKVGRGAICATGDEAVTVELREVLALCAEPPIEVWLGQGLPKGDKMELIVQKAVEIGAAGIIPLEMEFCTVRYDAAKKRARTERWQKIAQEAAKQCGRNFVPTVTAVKPLATALEQVSDDTAIILLYEGRGGRPLKEVLSGRAARRYLLLVGPEGGFSPADVATCEAKGAYSATLGPRILRTETAGLASLAIVLYAQGDLGS